MRVLVLFANDSILYDLWSNDRRMSSLISLSLSAGGCNLGPIVCNLIRTSTGYPVLIPVGPGWVHGRDECKDICRELVLGRNNVHQLTAFNLCIFSGIHTRSIIMDLLGRSDKIY